MNKMIGISDGSGDPGVSTVKSAVRVLDILEHLAHQGEPLALRDLVRNLKFPKSSTFALMRSLVSRGYVVRDRNDRYAIHPAFRDAFLRPSRFEDRLVAYAMPIMEVARDATGETVILAVQEATLDARLVAKCVSPQPLRWDSELGKMVPGYASVMGRVLLAHTDPARVDEYLARTPLHPFTPRTITDEGELRALLEDIRRRGYSIVEEEYALGGCGVAAPVFDADGTVVATVDIATIVQRFATAREAMIQAAVAAANEISARLGHRPGAGTEAGASEETH
ncbi:IclR family transcriptional regulator [Acuticoccus sediminis]|uniref:IclR family transcriptional regulator n=1 Tax=Acuticoccus sediminis TaxID=2184697 RepID=A0A8B2NS33_9HYPH|nr:IclR family transcriptional regulator [Acuticoccus sediminis]RAI00173.1 IclR family transcriptional regulator [Acuticoccus sediminis]